MIDRHTPGSTPSLLVYAHVGDLHVTTGKQQNFKDLLSILAQIEIDCGRLIDFVYLPGDNADNGRASQYQLVRTALKMLTVPVHVITGDHDMEGGSLDAFYSGLGVPKLPRAETIGGLRCLFLDICGPGSGGPDFRLGSDQLAWVEAALAEARDERLRTAVFLHSYPADLKPEGETARLGALLHEAHVVLVDMGHTHYNELANDGRTIFAATRSTGQIEEGPVGYTLAAVDDGVVSWRFKALDEPFPFVLITAPADRRLVTDPEDPAQVVGQNFEVHALVFGARDVERCAFSTDDGPWRPMYRAAGDRLWRADAAAPGQGGIIRLAVRAHDGSGRPGEDRIEIAAGRFDPAERRRDGSDADALGAWPEKGIVGTQLGPNRNAPGGS